MKKVIRSAVLMSCVASAAAFGTERPQVAPMPPPPSLGQVQPNQARTIEVTFVLDTTGSMGGLIEGAKRKIWSIASRMADAKPTPRIRVGLVAYRDRGDEYVTRKFDLSSDLDTVFANLQQFQAGGGGDHPEHVGRGLGEAVSGMSWSQDPNVMKTIFLVGDAPPQEYQDGWSFRDWAKNAIKKGITVSTVRCGGDHQTELAWREIARLADGSFVSIDQTGGMLAVATPYDEKLARLNAEIARRTSYGGDVAARGRSMEKAAAVAAMPASSAADRTGFMGKSMGGGMAASAAPSAEAGAVDLVAEPAKVATMGEAQLPEELRGLTPAQRVEKLQAKKAERKALEEEATKLAKERDAWIGKNAKTKADSFDENVMKDIKAKGAKYGLAYE